MNHRNHPHHVKSRGAGGGDVATNVMPLCHEHHQEIHQAGKSEMRKRYQGVNDWLTIAESVENQQQTEGEFK